MEALGGFSWITDVRPEAGGSVSAVLAPSHSPAELNQALFLQGLVLNSLEVRHRSLETHFLELTK
jgi:ABC-2 type transport system ATP-binding protein